MKNYNYLFLSILFCGNAAFAQTENAPQDIQAKEQTAKKVIGTFIDQYATVMGGYYVEGKCHLLPQQVDLQFEPNIDYATLKMKNVIGVNDKMLQAIDKAAKDTAANTQCDANGKSIAINTFNMSGKLRDNLTILEHNLPPNQKVLNNSN